MLYIELVLVGFIVGALTAGLIGTINKTDEIKKAYLQGRNDERTEIVAFYSSFMQRLIRKLNILDAILKNTPNQTKGTDA